MHLGGRGAGKNINIAAALRPFGQQTEAINRNAAYYVSEGQKRMWGGH